MYLNIIKSKTNKKQIPHIHTRTLRYNIQDLYEQGMNPVT